jgi:hypothetical protein
VHASATIFGAETEQRAAWSTCEARAGALSCLSIPPQGSIRVAGRVSYAAQDPWIRNASLRDNILMGTPMDLERYQRVLADCALLADIESMPAGARLSVFLSRSVRPSARRPACCAPIHQVRACRCLSFCLPARPPACLLHVHPLGPCLAGSCPYF